MGIQPAIRSRSEAGFLMKKLFLTSFLYLSTCLMPFEAFPQLIEVEPNDQSATATPIQADAFWRGTGTMEWTVKASDAWIDPKTTSGSLLIGEAQTIFIEVKREGLAPNAYQGSIALHWAGGATEVTIAMRVSGE